MPLLRRITLNTSSLISPLRYWATARSKRSMSRCCSASRSRGVGMTGAMVAGEVVTGVVMVRLIRPLLPFGQPQIRLVRSTIAGGHRDDNRKKVSTTRIFADLPEGVTKRDPQPADVIRVQVGHQTSSYVPDFLDREHHSRSAVVIVIADRHGPRHPHCVVGSCRNIVIGERVVVDRAAHVSPGAPRTRSMPQTALCAKCRR